MFQFNKTLDQYIKISQYRDHTEKLSGDASSNNPHIKYKDIEDSPNNKYLLILVPYKLLNN